jgi:hypothetical protein
MGQLMSSMLDTVLAVGIVVCFPLAALHPSGIATLLTAVFCCGAAARFAYARHHA